MTGAEKLYGIEKTREEIESQINEHRDLKAVEEMLISRDLSDRKKGLYGFYCHGRTVEIPEKMGTDTAHPSDIRTRTSSLCSYFILPDIHGDQGL